MRLIRPPAAVMMGATLALSTAGAQTIDTRGDRDFIVAASTGIGGQTFTAPAGLPYVIDFSLWLWTSPGGPYQYRASLHRWDDAQRVVGPALYTSEVRETESAPGDVVGVVATFETPGVTLMPGQTYVALAQRVAPGNVFLGFADLSASGFQDTYAGGMAIEAIGYAADPALAAYRPMSIGPGTDLRFVAHLGATPVTAVPEPATLSLLAPALAAIARLRRRCTSTSPASPTHD